MNDLSAELAGELAAAGFAGMKDSTGDFARHEAYLDATRERDFELYIGSEPLVLRAYREGAAGAITGLAGARPELFARLREALEAGDDAAAEARPGRDRRRQGRGRVRGLDRRRGQAPRRGAARGLPARPARALRLAGLTRLVVVAGLASSPPPRPGAVGIAPMLLSSFLIALRSAAPACASSLSKASPSAGVIGGDGAPSRPCRARARACAAPTDVVVGLLGAAQ